MKDVEMSYTSDSGGDEDAADNQPILKNSPSHSSSISRKTHVAIVFGILLLLVLPLLVATVILAVEAGQEDGSTAAEDSNAWKQGFMIEANSGAVATDDGRCSDIAASILDKGGNAMDAAISAALCLGVVSPSSSGLGGGCFVLGRNSSKDVTFIDSREVAPQAATEDMFFNNSLASIWGGLAVAVPAELRGLYLAYQEQGGLLPWEDLVTPSISLAEEYTISDHFGEHIQRISPVIESDPVLYKEIRKFLTRSDGSYKSAGDVINNPALAETLKQVSKNPEYLHDTMASTLAAEVQAAGGILTASDISSYAPKLREAVQYDIFGHKVYSSPPPSSGGLIVVAILQFMEGFLEPLVSVGEIYYHYLAEAMKHGFAMRMSLGDPDFVNVTQVEVDILQNGYVESLRQMTNDYDVLNLTEYGGSDYGVMEEDLNHLKGLPEDHGTSHLSVVDAWGNAVAITSTVNFYLGSLIYSPSTGIVFNDQMDDFSSPNSTNVFGLHPFESNYIKAGKRPLSSMSPTIVVRNSNNRVRLVGGASGGPRIITSTAQVILNFIGKGMSILDAVVNGRIHTQLLPEVVGVEDQTVSCAPDVCQSSDGSPTYHKIEAGDDVQSALTSRNHKISVNEGTGFAVSQFIEVKHDTSENELTAVSDPRKGGTPAGSYS